MDREQDRIISRSIETGRLYHEALDLRAVGPAIDRDSLERRQLIRVHDRVIQMSQCDAGAPFRQSHVESRSGCEPL